MRIILVAGGTGGHIYPALALADELCSQIKDCTILFVGSKNRMEQKIIGESKYEFLGLNLNSSSGNILNKIGFVNQLFKSYIKSTQILNQFKPDIVIGFGNYISVPMLMAAHNKKIKTMIHEQNSYAGKANLFLGKYVDAIVGCYDENLTQFKNNNIKILGNPRCQVAANYQSNINELKQIGLDSKRPYILIIMGSLGSSSVNSVMMQCLESFSQKNYQVVFVTGNQAFNDFKDLVGKYDNVKIVAYVDGINLMKNAKLCITRGGATTAAEISVLNVPSIIIPSPYVPNNHQYINALALVNCGCAKIVEEKDLSQQLLIDNIDDLMNNQFKLEQMIESAKKIGHPNSTNDIIKWILEIKENKYD